MFKPEALQFITKYYSITKQDDGHKFTPKVEFLMIGKSSRIKLDPVVIEEKDKDKALDSFADKFIETINSL